MTTAAPKTELQEALESIYTTDFDLIEAQGRDPEALVGSRRCKACRAAPPRAAAKGKKKKASAKDHRKRIQTHCSQQPDYLEPDLPLQELAFRLLLAAPEPLSLSALHQRFSDLWVGAASPRHIGREALDRVLAHSMYYGTVQVNKEEGESESAEG